MYICMRANANLNYRLCFCQLRVGAIRHGLILFVVIGWPQLSHTCSKLLVFDLQYGKHPIHNL